MSWQPILHEQRWEKNVSCSRTTTQWRRWGSNPRPFGLESSTLPLSHWAPKLSGCVFEKKYRPWDDCNIWSGYLIYPTPVDFLKIICMRPIKAQISLRTTVLSVLLFLERIYKKYIWKWIFLPKKFISLNWSKFIVNRFFGLNFTCRGHSFYWLPIFGPLF